MIYFLLIISISKMTTLAQRQENEDRELRQLMESKYHKPKQQMYLKRCNLGLAGIQYFCNLNWQHLRILWLQQNRIDDQAVKLMVSRQWPNMRQLYFDVNMITNKGVRHLVSIPWPTLIKLSLYGNSIGLEGAKSISKAYWPNLIQLWMSSNKLGDESMRALMRANWNKLQIISLCNNQVAIFGCIGIAKANWSNSLREIAISKSHCYQDNNRIPRSTHQLLTEMLAQNYEIQLNWGN